VRSTVRLQPFSMFCPKCSLGRTDLLLLAGLFASRNLGPGFGTAGHFARFCQGRALHYRSPADTFAPLLLQVLYLLPRIVVCSELSSPLVAKGLAPAGNGVLRSGEAVIRHPSLRQPYIQVSCVLVSQN